MSCHAMDLTGFRVGRLLVISREGSIGGKPAWKCSCDCGNETVVRAAVLRREGARSCGCLARELTSDRSTTHGATNTPEWDAWQRILKRCTSSEAYVKAGVRVCDEWRHDFLSFFAHIGSMPPDKRTVDRIDNSRGYEPGNVRWASTEEQNRNKTSNVKLTVGGETMTVAEWARRVGMSQTGLHDRIARGMSDEEAVTVPSRKRRTT